MNSMLVILGICIILLIIVLASYLAVGILYIIKKVNKSNKIKITVAFITATVLIAVISSYYLLIKIYYPTEKELISGFYNCSENQPQIYEDGIQKYELKSFSPSKYEIGINNFSDGVCLGIVLFIKQQYAMKKPCKIILSQKEETLLYQMVPGNIISQHLTENPGKYTNYKWNEVLEKRNKKILLSKFKPNSPIREICTLQKNQLPKSYIIFNLDSNNAPFSQKILKIASISILSITSKKVPISEIDLNWIKMNLNNDIPVVIGVKNKLSGHALLCYKMVEYDNSTRLYVLDPNIIYSLHAEMHLEDCTYIDIATYKSKQYYNYNPCINGNYPYHGIYNSFTPESTLSWQ